MSSLSVDVCNTTLLYNKGVYEYSLPKGVLDKFLSGKAFDYPEVYTDEESASLKEDINELYAKIVSCNPIKDSLAVITAGAPGAGKTIKMCQDLNKQAAEGRRYAYICPDDVCLKGQTRTYQAALKSGAGSKEDRLGAYNKWRPGSNAATHLILGTLIRERYAFYFGTTSTGESTHQFFRFLKTQDYRIRLIHVTAPDDVRWRSIQKRDETFVQTTEEDVKNKGNLLPQRIMDTFLLYADEIEFHYRNGVEQDAQPVATWVRNRPEEPVLGTLTVIDPLQYDHIKTIHDTAVKALGKQELLWSETVEKNSHIKQKASPD